MQLKKLLSEDDAVSPVIGVILMVAITVILAAVIASFVLGLGDTADEVQPNSSISLDNVDQGNGATETTVTLTLTDGDTIDEDEIIFRGSAIDGDSLELGDVADDVSGDEWNVGESITLDQDQSELAGNDDDVTLNVVWEESGGDNSATLATFNFDIEDAS